MLDAQSMQVGDDLTDPRLERVLDAEHADDLAIDRQIQRRQALHLRLDLLLNVGLELRALILKYKVRGTDDGATPFDGRSDAVCHDVLDDSMPHAMPCTQAFFTGALASSLMPAVPSRKPPPTSRVLNVGFFMLLLPFAALDTARCLSTRVNKFTKAHFWKII